MRPPCKPSPERALSFHCCVPFCRFQLFGKIGELESQLTSDEPKENVDASPALLARQDQLDAAIKSASAQLQSEAHGLLDQLKQVLPYVSLYTTYP